MQSIQITSLSGHSPFNISICDITKTYCYVVETGVISVPTTVDIPTELSGTQELIVKITDSIGCETFHPYYCFTPTPTPTHTPTPTQTMSVNCNCLTFINTTETNLTFYYTNCNNQNYPYPIQPGTILYVCGKSPSADVGVVYYVGDPCYNNSCPLPSQTPTNTQTPTQTKTPTVTPTQTQTPTQTPTPTPSNVPIIYNADYVVFRYNFAMTSGADLDTMTTLYVNEETTPYANSSNPLGYCSYGGFGGPNLWFGGDNTGYGTESVYIDIKNLRLSGSVNSVQIDCRANWYGALGDGILGIQMFAYSGGTMSRDGNYGFINVGGTLLGNYDFPNVDITVLNTSCTSNECVGLYGYNILTGEFTVQPCISVTPTPTPTPTKTPTQTPTLTPTMTQTSTPTHTSAGLVLELYGCCDSTTQYVTYNPSLVYPGTYTATNDLPYQIVSVTPIAGVPTVTIIDYANYIDCASWLTIFGGCP